MASTRSFRLGWRDIATNSTSDHFHPATIWQPIAGPGGAMPGSVRSSMELRGKWGTGTVSIVPGYQTCGLDETAPDNTPGGVAIPIENGAGTPPGYANADGCYECASAGALTVTMGAKKKIRFGWIVKVSASTGGGSVSGTIDMMY